MKALRIPKGGVKPRPAIVEMAPYSPPTGNRADKLRLDFNENTVGCSPRVIQALKNGLAPAALSIYPDYAEAREAVARYFQVSPDQFTFTNGTDEAIQVFVNTYLDDGQEAVLLKPSYAMYRFYCEVAGAKVTEIEYPDPGLEFPLQQVLDAITPDTRAVLISNPNNPTGTGISLTAIDRILRRARKAVVLIDEAYYEFSGVTALGQIERAPNLFVSRTFSKVFGMAAMRLGCLFSHAANVAFLRKAQSPYSVNSLAVMAAQAAVADGEYVRNYVAEVLAARELLCLGLERLGIPYVPSSANFVLARFGKRSIEVRDALRGRAILVRDRSYECPGAVRITVGTRAQTRQLLAALEEVLGKMTKPLLIFDMDGVLVDVTESYRETILRTVAHFTGAAVTHAQIQEYKNRGGFNDDWELSHRMIQDAGGHAPFDAVKECFQRLFLGGNGDGMILRERWVAQPGVLEKLSERFQMAIFTGRPRVEADLTLNRFAASLTFDPVIGMYEVEKRKPHPEGLLAILNAQKADGEPREAFYIGDSVDDARCARAAGVPFIGIAAPSNPAYLDLVFLFHDEKAYAIVDDINYLEEVFPA